MIDASKTILVVLACVLLALLLAFDVLGAVYQVGALP